MIPSTDANASNYTHWMEFQTNIHLIWYFLISLFVCFCLIYVCIACILYTTYQYLESSKWNNVLNCIWWRTEINALFNFQLTNRMNVICQLKFRWNFWCITCFAYVFEVYSSVYMAWILQQVPSNSLSGFKFIQLNCIR